LPHVIGGSIHNFLNISNADYFLPVRALAQGYVSHSIVVDGRFISDKVKKTFPGHLLTQTPAFTYDLKSAYALRLSRRLFRYEKLPTKLISGLRRCHKLLQTRRRMRGME